MQPTHQRMSVSPPFDQAAFAQHMGRAKALVAKMPNGPVQANVEHVIWYACSLWEALLEMEKLAGITIHVKAMEWERNPADKVKEIEEEIRLAKRELSKIVDAKDCEEVYWQCDAAVRGLNYMYGLKASSL